MDFNSTIEIILHDLREVRVSVIQVELAKSKCKSAEEVIALFKNLNPESISAPPAVKPAVQTPEPVLADDDSLIVISDEEPADIETKDETQPPAATRSSRKEVPIFADRFSGTQQTIFDQLGGEKDNGTHDIIKNQIIENLTDAIGINDKFLFTREIFGGDRDRYEEALSKLNAAGSYSDAKAILLSYVAEGEDNVFVRQLLEIVKRKLPADG